MSVKSVNLPSKFLLNIIDARLTATETRLLLCIAFYTFGINSEFCPLSYGFLSQAANIYESDTKKLIRNLEKRQIIKNYKIPGNKNKNLWGIDKSFYLFEYQKCDGKGRKGYFSAKFFYFFLGKICEGAYSLAYQNFAAF